MSFPLPLRYRFISGKVAFFFRNIRETHEPRRIRKSITYEEWLGRDSPYPRHMHMHRYP